MLPALLLLKKKKQVTEGKNVDQGVAFSVIENVRFHSTFWSGIGIPERQELLQEQSMQGASYRYSSIDAMWAQLWMHPFEVLFLSYPLEP